MTNVTRAVGAVLIAVGLIAYVATGAESVTALAPALVGLAILLLGVFAGREHLRRHMIHGALVVARRGLVASLPMAVGRLTGEAGAPQMTSMITALICAVYVGLGVRSFVAARRRR